MSPRRKIIEHSRRFDPRPSTATRSAEGPDRAQSRAAHGLVDDPMTPRRRPDGGPRKTSAVRRRRQGNPRRADPPAQAPAKTAAGRKAPPQARIGRAVHGALQAKLTKVSLGQSGRRRRLPPRVWRGRARPDLPVAANGWRRLLRCADGGSFCLGVWDNLEPRPHAAFGASCVKFGFPAPSCWRRCRSGPVQRRSRFSSACSPLPDHLRINFVVASPWSTASPASAAPFARRLVCIAYFLATYGRPLRADRLFDRAGR